MVPTEYRIVEQGCRISGKWLLCPIMGTVGMILKAAYNAEKIAIAAIAFVFRLRCLRLLIFLRPD